MTSREPQKLAALLARIRKTTELRGEKKALAEFLGTSPQGLNDWLSGRRAPGGEVTLLMLEWVTAEEANQQKTVAVLRTPQRQKTRKLNPRYEKSKRVRTRK